MGPKICLGGLVLRVSRGPGRELTDVNVAINKHIVTKRQKLINNTKPAADAAAPDGMA